jgi:CHAT domain-containing protein/tetratricopeptide (TPR) repeat protein
LPLRQSQQNHRAIMRHARATLRIYCLAIEHTPLDRNAEDTKQLAEGLVHGTTTLPDNLSTAGRVNLAWALKDYGAASWNSEPQNTVGAAQAINALCETLAPDSPDAITAETLAVRDWVNGFADLTNGAMSQAIEHFDAAAARFRAVGRETEATHTQIPKVIALSILGEFARAEECGSTALAKLLQAGDMQAACRLSANLGNVNLEINDYDAALKHFERGAEIALTLSDFERRATCLIGIANVHKMLGDFAIAIEKYDMAEAITKKHGLSFLQAIIAESVALLRLARGEYTAALRGFERARSQFEALDAPQNVAIAEKQLADTYLDLRLLAEAQVLLQDSVARFEALEMFAEKALGLTQLGRAFALIDATRTKANACFDEAEALFAEQNIPAGQASVKFARAELALFEKKYALARASALDAAAIFETLKLSANELVARIVASFAALESGSVDESTNEFPALLNRAKQLELRSAEVRCLVGIGVGLQRRGDTEGAKISFESAIDAFEEQRSALPGDDIRSAFLVDHARSYSELLRIALDAHTREPSPSAAREALRQVERFRARALTERLGEPQVLHDKGLLSKSYDEIQLRQRLNWLNHHIRQLIEDSDDVEIATQEGRAVERDLLEHARRRRIAAVAESNSQTVEFAQMHTFDLDALCAALTADTDAIVEYFALDDELFAFIIDHDGVVLNRNVASWSDVREAIETTRFQIETMRFGLHTAAQHGERLNQRVRAAMEALHRLLWTPIEAALAGKQRVLIVPHEQLGAIQFSALFDGQQYLAEKLDIAIVPSAHAARYGLAHVPRTPERALVLGETTRLLHAKEEAQFVASLFDRADLLVDEHANVENLRSHCSHADVLHLACHAQFRSDNPMFSALELADQSFAAVDAETLDLRSSIVTLSACETGLAQYDHGDEMFGLVRSFLVAGASRIVASLWAVDDATTKRFMGVFYRALKRGAVPASALREAQREVMKAHPHPFYWAAFVLYGGW